MQHSKPYHNSHLSKKQQIAQMFDTVAQKYDLANKILSAGIDKRWRSKVVSLLRPHRPQYILDIATGTGDLAMAMRQLHPIQIVGVDISANMIAIGQEKISKSGYADLITMRIGDGEQLDFPDATFDALTVAFGFRNFEQREKGLDEMFRVLRPKGVCLILEFSQPTHFLSKWFYSFYLQIVIPNLGGWISGHREAYKYLNQSIRTFPKNSEVIHQMKTSGFKNVNSISLSGGICRIWRGEK